MLPIGRYTQRYTFTLKICDSVGTLIDMTIGATPAPDSLAKAKEAVQKALEEYTPTPSGVKAPAQNPEMPITPGMIMELRAKGKTSPDPAPAAEPVEDTPAQDLAPTEDPAPAAKLPYYMTLAKPPAGAKGLLRLRCPDCGNIFGTFLREPKTEIDCKCGHHIDLTGPLARYRFTCPYCEKDSWGYTNLEDPEITIRCKCGGDVELRWNAKAKEYQN